MALAYTNQVYNHTPCDFERHGTYLIPCAEELKVLTKLRAWRSQGKSMIAIAGEPIGLAPMCDDQRYALIINSITKVAMDCRRDGGAWAMGFCAGRHERC